MDDKVNKYKYRRLYTNCISNDERTSSRGYIKRKHRIIIPSIVFILLICLNFIFVITDTSNYIVFLMVSILAVVCVMSITKTGVISLLNILNLNSIKRKKNKNIFDEFFIYINKDGNIFPINDRYLRSIKENIVFWTKLKLIFSDSLKNEYWILISRKKIEIRIRSVNNNIIEGQLKNKIYTYKMKEINDLNSIDEFVEFIRSIFREAKNVLNEQIQKTCT